MLGFRHILGSHQLRLSGTLDIQNVSDHCFVALFRGCIDVISFIKTLGRHIRLDNGDVETVELAQLITCGQRGTRHATDLVIHAQQRLNGDLI